MIKKLQQLGLSQKEAQIYLALNELGTQPASIIAQKVQIPKSSVLFHCDHLLKKNLIRKNQKGRTQYFSVDLQDLTQEITKEIEQKSSTLNETTALLKELRSPLSSQPQVTFYEGIKSCRKAYQNLVNENENCEILEFGAHNDLINKLGDKFMNDFIKKRCQKNIHLKAITHTKLKKLDPKQKREIRPLPSSSGPIHSSITITKNKVLILNLLTDPFAIEIQNSELSTTLRTIFNVCWEK